jgi:hypothetical protein
VDRVHASVDQPGALGPPWTNGGVDRVGAGARQHAHRSSTSGRSGAQKLTGGGATERGAHEELGQGLTGAQAASSRTGDDGEGSAASVLGERVAQAWREGKRSGERCGETRWGCSPFIGGRGSTGEG